MAIVFERLVGRDIVRFLSNELDLAGLRTTVNTFLAIAIIGWIVITIIISFYLTIAFNLNPGLSLLGGIVVSVIYELLLYAILEFKIEQRKDFVESVLPDYLQLTAADVRSGIAMSKALTLSARSEFKYFTSDIDIMTKQLYSGETMQKALTELANKYRSLVLKRTIRMIIEATQYGGGLADLLTQISKDLRTQQIIQKEVSGQLFMYTIFIGFAALIGAPALYGLTNEMITITSKVWTKIAIGSLSTLPSVGISFLKFSKPQITIEAYYYFSLAAIVIITGFGSFIVSAISTGSTSKGLKYLPIFILVGLTVFYVVSGFMAGLFASISR